LALEKDRDRALRFDFSVTAYPVSLSCCHRAAVARELAFGLSFASAKQNRGDKPISRGEKAPPFGEAGL
jgi:hypothetical protein